MAEHIVGYQNLIQRLRECIKERRLPHVLALEAPPYSGKLSLALALARNLCCPSQNSSSTCTCDTCMRQAQLLPSELMIIGNRRFLPEIVYAAAMLQTHYDEQSLLYFRRAVRKLLKRFDPQIVNRAHLKGLESRLEEVENALTSLSGSLQELDGIVSQCRKLAQSAAMAINMTTVRNVIATSHYTGPTRVLIIENLQQIHEHSANALLKLFEEPPANLYIICTLTQRYFLLPTIASRLHVVHLPLLSDEDRLLLFRDILRAPLQTSVRMFFLAHYYGFSLKELAALLVRELSGAQKLFSPAFADRSAKVDAKELFFDVLDCAVPEFSRVLRSAGTHEVLHLKRRWRQLMHARMLMLQRNIGLASVTDLLKQEMTL